MESTPRTTVRRLADRGRYDTATVHAILDAAPACTVAFVEEGAPVAIPTIHARLDEVLYLHGSPASRLLTVAASGEELCVAATLIDGIVVARSAFNSSLNYRSVVLFGRGRLVTDLDEKLAAMRAVTEHILPGRWDELRAPTSKEIAGTAIVAMPIEEASAKVRSGPPKDDEGDAAIWSGVIPLRTVPGEPLPERDLPTPESVAAFVRSAPSA